MLLLDLVQYIFLILLHGFGTSLPTFCAFFLWSFGRPHPPASLFCHENDVENAQKQKENKGFHNVEELDTMGRCNGKCAKIIRT